MWVFIYCYENTTRCSCKCTKVSLSFAACFSSRFPYFRVTVHDWMHTYSNKSVDNKTLATVLCLFHFGSWIVTAKPANTCVQWTLGECECAYAIRLQPVNTEALQINHKTYLHSASAFRKPLRPLRFRRQNPTNHRKPSAESPLCRSTEWWRYLDRRWPRLSDHNRRLHVI